MSVPSGQRSFRRGVLRSPGTEVARRRDCFYRLVASEYPHVFDELRNDVLPITSDLGLKLAFDPRPERHPALFQGLRRWAKRYGLDQHWVVRDVSDYLITCSVDPHLPPAHPHSQTEGGGDIYEPVHVHAFIVWPISSMSQSQFRESALQKLEAELDAAIAEVEERATSNGAISVDTRKLEEHMLWLVRSRFGRKKYQEISKEFSPEGTSMQPSDVGKAIRAAAASIGLKPRRTRKRGRHVTRRGDEKGDYKF